MNKNWKIVLMVVVMLFTAIFTITDVNATNTIKLTSKSYIKAGGRNHAWFKTNAGYAYCITPQVLVLVLRCILIKRSLVLVEMYFITC